MKAKVFISCGQRPEERKTAEGVRNWLNSIGFDAWLAVDVKTIFDLNQGVMDALKRSDYYLFINFPREQVTTLKGETFERGSLYSHQELAVAYALEFEQMIIVNHKGYKREGVLDPLICNTDEFSSMDEVLPIVQAAILAPDSGWHPTYSRSLVVREGHWGGACEFTDQSVWKGHQTCQKKIVAYHLHLENRRKHEGAFETVARLESIAKDGATVPSPDKSHLKASGFGESYSQVIWPRSYGEIDAFLINHVNPTEIYLSSARDFSPREPFISSAGHYRLDYEFFARGFPRATATIELEVTGEIETTIASLKLRSSKEPFSYRPEMAVE